MRQLQGPAAVSATELYPGSSLSLDLTKCRARILSLSAAPSQLPYKPYTRRTRSVSARYVCWLSLGASVVRAPPHRNCYGYCEQVSVPGAHPDATKYTFYKYFPHEIGYDFCRICGDVTEDGLGMTARCEQNRYLYATHKLVSGGHG